MAKYIIMAILCGLMLAEEGALVSDIRKADNVFYEGVMLWSKDADKASEYLNAACESKHPGACLYLGQYYAIKSQSRNAKEAKNNALEYYQKGYEYALQACQEGAKEWCAIQAVALIDGKGVSKDIKKGLEYMEILCEREIAGACSLLASYYEYGINVPKDETKAKDYALKTLKLDDEACESKQLYACVMSAEIYQQGLGVEQDLNMAKTFYHRACEINNRFACDYVKKLK